MSVVTGTTGSPGGRRNVWRHRDWRLLTLAQGFSGVGDWAYAIALVVWIGQRTDASPVWLAAAMVVRLLPIAVLAPLGGAVADRFDRRRILLAADAARTALMLALVAIIAVDGPIVVGLSIAALTECATAFARPSFYASIPALVGEDDLAAASATGSIVNQIAILLGPLVAGIVIAITSVRMVVLIDVASFVASFVLTARIRAGTAPAASSDPARFEHGDHDRRGNSWGLRSFVAIPGVGALLALITVSELVYGAESVLQPLVAFDRLHAPAAVGLFAGAVGLGGFLIAPFVPRVARRSRLVGPFVLANVLGAVPLMLLAATRTTAVASSVLLVEGAGMVVYEVLAYMLIQRSVPAANLGRSLGMREAIVTGAQLIGAIATPAVVHVLGLEAGLLVFGGALAIASTVAWGPLRALDRAAAHRAEVLVPIVDVLRASTLLADATQATLEMVAASITTVEVPAGTRVITEGDPADTVWLVRDGVFTATTGDGYGGRRTLSEMGAGTWFGEIGVIGRRPRTADVTATTDAIAWCVPGPTLLAAIEGGARVSDPAARLMELRLLRSAAA